MTEDQGDSYWIEDEDELTNKIARTMRDRQRRYGPGRWFKLDLLVFGSEGEARERIKRLIGMGKLEQQPIAGHGYGQEYHWKEPID